MDKTQLGAAIIAFSLLLIVSPFGVAKAPGMSATEFVGAMTILAVFYGIVFLVAGVAVFFVHEAPKV
jgi:hypothetical protein